MSRTKGAAKSGGRKQGTPNRTTKEARALFVQIMNNEIPNIEDALKKIKAESPAKYIDALAKLFQYTIPKQLDVTSDGESINTIKLIRGNEGIGNKP
jgi:hypothetical protein